MPLKAFRVLFNLFDHEIKTKTTINSSRRWIWLSIIFHPSSTVLFLFLFSFLKLKIRRGPKAPSAPTQTTPLQVTGKWFSNSFGSHSTVQQIMPFPYSQDYQYVRCRKDFISEKSGFHLMFMYCNHFSWKYSSEYFAVYEMD